MCSFSESAAQQAAETRLNPSSNKLAARPEKTWYQHRWKLADAYQTNVSFPMIACFSQASSQLAELERMCHAPMPLALRHEAVDVTTTSMGLMASATTRDRPSSPHSRLSTCFWQNARDLRSARLVQHAKDAKSCGPAGERRAKSKRRETMPPNSSS